MDRKMQTFIEFLLDTETTSEVSFSQAISVDNALYHARHKSVLESFVKEKLQQWKNAYLTEQRAIADRISMNTRTEEADDQSETESEDESSSDHEESQASSQPLQNTQVSRPSKPLNTYIDPVGQCKRLLQLLYHRQQKSRHLADLYFDTLDLCVKSEEAKLVGVALQQIALHLSDGVSDQNEHKRLVKCLSSISTSSAVLEEHRPILATIESLLSTKNTEENDSLTTSLNILDTLYPYRARFLDVRREFRDSTHYFIDGDSLILSIAHHVNIDLESYHGNTLHMIFIIERILQTLFNQTNQCNYTLVFFDCHYQLYRREKSILNLLRPSLILHLSRNADKCSSSRVRQFSSWLDNEYVTFATEEKPHFVFYHDMSSFAVDSLLSEETLKNLLYIYRLFGNYHQYELQCHLYLMNKLMLSDTTVKCFEVEFKRRCSSKLLNKAVRTRPFSQNDGDIKDDDWIEYEKKQREVAGQDDVRLYLYSRTIMTLIKNITNPSKEYNLFHLLSPLLILHVSLLIRLSLVDRHLPLNFPAIKFSSMLSELILQFQQHLSRYLTSSFSSSSLSWSKIGDLFDGRLFAFTLYQLHQSASKTFFDSETMDLARKSLSLLDFPTDDSVFCNSVKELIQSSAVVISSSPVEGKSVPIKQQKIVRVSNRFIDTYLQPIISGDNNLPLNFVEPEEVHSIRYEGKYHWHVYKEVGDEISRIRDNDEKKAKHTNHRYRTTNQQRFYSYFTLYGKSLTSRDVKDSQLQIVLPTAAAAASSIDKDTAVDKSAAKKKGPPKKGPQNKAERIREENRRQKLEKLGKNENDQVSFVDDLLKDVPSNDYSRAIDIIDGYLSKFQTPDSRLRLLKTKFDLQRKYLRQLKRKQNDSPTTPTSPLDLLRIDYFATMTGLADLEKTADVFNEKKEYLEELLDHSPLDREQWYRFQLGKVNSWLPRREQGVPDQRVPDFIPDRWQVEFLDAVDNDQSVIIVAPTASGKTYASYYAMNKVLRHTDGLCVYVAPTKALVNQVAATIHYKFGPVFGIFTRDYRMNMRVCRILVTVPQCLEILLLSPSHQHWCKRIKYVIFDEIHCMSGEIGSDVWEKNMLLINCPMIGLSATVNNGRELSEWIQSVENQRSVLFKTPAPRRVYFIAHHERMADLNKYVYSNHQLHPIHPVGMMNAKQLLTRGIPKDFSLSPCETLQLSDAIQSVIPRIESPEIRAAVERRPLNEQFAPDWIVERSVFNDYSRVVCNQLNDLVVAKESATIDSITRSLDSITSKDIQYPQAKGNSSLIVEFVETLKKKNLLPCIVFSDSRILCEQMAESVARNLRNVERELTETKYKDEIERLQKRSELLEKTHKKTKAKKTSTKRNRDDDNPAESNVHDEEEDSEYLKLSGRERQLLDGTLDEGTLRNQLGYDQELVDNLLERAKRENPRLVEYMKRGVAYHHAGLNNKGRVAVEALFRNRYVQVVFSTSTLALGIHMPTKTVAFVKDSIYLDALQYRQSSGRAGRRGFDIQGHVVFIDIPLSKIRHLTISAIPDIQTFFPTSVTFVMRLLHLCSNAKDKNDAINRSLIALQCPFIAHAPMRSTLIDVQTRFHCLFTLDFLYQLNLIDGQGNLIGLAGLLTHLHYFEPANILLVYLMNHGLFRQIKDQDEIMTVFAYLFTYMPWLITHREFESLSERRRESKFNSKLFLPTVSPVFRKHVNAYNTIVKDIYGCYIDNVTRYLRSMKQGREETLPFSNVSFARDFDYDPGTFEYRLHHHQSQQLHNPSISPFAGPSGLTHQRYISNYNPTVGSWDLAYDLDLSSRIVPFVDIDCCDHTGAAYHLNSYALDFFKQGSETSLIIENGLNPGDTHNLLLDLHLVLSSIRTSLEVIVNDENTSTSVDDSIILRPLHQSISKVQSIFANNFSHQYPGRNHV